MLQHSSLNEVFHALADPTRRAMLERLAAGPLSVSQLGAPYPVSLSAIGQHIQLLENSGLVRTHKVGRVRHVELDAGALAGAEQWFVNHRARWQQRFDRLERLLDDSDTPPKRRRKP